MMSPERQPARAPRLGYCWVWHEGCDCAACAGLSCVGRTWPHWREVKIGTLTIAEGYASMLDGCHARDADHS